MRASPITAVTAVAVVVTAALTTTTTSVAATMITSADIKNHTIQLNDLSSKAVKALNGPTGAAGSPGATGSQGPEGSVLAWASIGADGTVDPANSQGITVTALVPSSGGFCLQYTGGTPRNVEIAALPTATAARVTIAVTTAQSVVHQAGQCGAASPANILIYTGVNGSSIRTGIEVSVVS